MKKSIDFKSLGYVHILSALSLLFVSGLSSSAAFALSAQAYFAPFDAVEEQVLRKLERANESIVVAHYNIRRQPVIDKLIEKHRSGVEVTVVVDKTNAAKAHNLGDDQLEAAGIPLYRLKPRGSRSLMHLKSAVIDGKTLMTGSFNWNGTAALANDENMLILEEPALARAYAKQIREVIANERQERDLELPSTVSLHFSPETNLSQIIVDSIDAATRSVQVAMFTFTERNVARSLINAHNRGVEVELITESKQERFSRADENLGEAGIRVLYAANRIGSFSAMHHKYAVIDGDTVITGATNWTRNGTRSSDEDLLIVRDRELARQYQNNFSDLQFVYGNRVGRLLEARQETRKFLFHVKVENLDAQQVFLTGSLSELGNWNVLAGVPLESSGSMRPNWTGRLTLPAGTDLDYKFVAVDAAGNTIWESGENRSWNSYSHGHNVILQHQFSSTGFFWMPSSDSRFF